LKYSTTNSCNAPAARSIDFHQDGTVYECLLSGPPESINMRAGYVVLLPGESVDEHSTGNAEEMLIPLVGLGELRIPGLDSIAIRQGCVLYNPPHTSHKVINTGDRPLRYIYVVAGIQD
jgi:quercetin dioxygenase-like cupin family protein